MIIFALGRQPEISLAELTAVFHKTPVLLTNQLAQLDITSTVALGRASQLGSIVKITQIVQDQFTIDQAHLDSLAKQLFSNTSGKITIGLSFYDRRISKRSANQLGQDLQTVLKNQGHSVRLLPSDTASLSTAAVLHNKLTTGNPKKMELNFIGKFVAQTIYVQDINAYTFRDRSRPRRDARNGMLPPKLAQVMVNLGVDATKVVQPGNLLDPFCGTGVILQEATLMGVTVLGTDINPQMIEYTSANLAWLSRTHHINITSRLDPADATAFDWQNWIKPKTITTVVTETYLGHPYTNIPSLSELKTNINNCNIIISKFIDNISRQLPSGAGLCVGVPAWFIKGRTYHLPCINGFSQYSFSNLTTGDNLIYHRPNQIVGRELLVLQKR